MKQILIFVLFAQLLCWLIFAPVYKHILILRHALLQKEVDYMLEVGANGSHGYIDEEMLEESRQRLLDRGFEPNLLQYDIQALSGQSATNPSQPILRGDGLVLSISYPYEQVFAIDKLIGVEGPSPNERLRVRGIRMSEFIPHLQSTNQVVP